MPPRKNNEGAHLQQSPMPRQKVRHSMHIRRLLLMGPDEILISRYQSWGLSLMLCGRGHETFNSANEGGFFRDTERVPIIVVNQTPN